MTFTAIRIDDLALDQELTDDATVGPELAQAAQSANDTATVIAAYEAFLKLAPDDPTAPEVRKILKQYKQFGSTG